MHPAVPLSLPVMASKLPVEDPIELESLVREEIMVKRVVGQSPQQKITTYIYM